MKSLTDYIVESQKVNLDSDGKENGFDYVDLGLPSGTKWATCNVGADSATSDGLLFQFGKTDGYVYGDTNNKFTTGPENEGLTGNQYINPTTSKTEYGKGQKLSLADDMAHANMGGNWIMPTKEDLQELYNNTTRQVKTINGKQGMLFTSNNNGKSIFVVFAGYCQYYDGQFYSRDSDGYLRSSEVNSDDPDYAWYLYFDSNGNCGIYNGARAPGYSVRGVLKSDSDLTTPTPTPTGTPTPTPAEPTPTSTPAPTPSVDINVESLTAGDVSNNGYSYVDLGLPSGTKWATCNVGADSATSDGLLFQFGKTDGYAYGDTNNDFTTRAQNKVLTGNEYINPINPTASGKKYYKGQTLSLEDDAAHVNMGGNWIMPTKDDLQELYDNTTKQVVTINGKRGMLFTSNINGKSIFVVFAGYCLYFDGQFYGRVSDGYLRSSEVNSDYPGFAWYLYFNSDGNCSIHYGGARANGFSVRGVLKTNN